MVFAKFVKVAAFGLTAALVLSLGTTAGMAQQDKAGAKAPPTPAAQPPATATELKPDLWYKLCMDVPVQDPPKPGEQPKPQKPEDMKKVNVCLTQADVRDNATVILVAKLVVRQIAGQDKPQMLAMLPLSSSIPPGVLVKIDDKEPIKLVYTSCDQAGCYAEANIEPAMVNQMKTGKQIAFLGVDVTGRSLMIPLPLEGFAKAIDGPSLAIDKYNDDQRKIGELIKQRLAELQKKREETAQSTQPPAPAPAKSDKKGK